ncbi:MAG: sugar-binding domain-containing protein [Verrucomicrobiota bacterium]|jgi:beta-mannosidase
MKSIHCLATGFIFPAALAAVCFGLIASCSTRADKTVGESAPAEQANVVTLSSGWELQDIGNAREPGEVISTAAYAPAKWFKATVPGTVLTSLVNDGVYPEPLYGENNRTNVIPESLCRASYWYRTKVSVPRDFDGKQIWLNFDGINYTAEIWVNGHNLGDIRGAFVRGIFNVTQFVKPGETAVVAVLIQPPLHPGTPLEQTVANGTGGNGGILSQDGPTFICTLGWDWIPGIRDRDMGIWQKVTLAATGPVVVENPLVTSHLPLPRTDVADLTVEATVHNVTDAPQSGVLSGAFDGRNFSANVTLAAGESKLVKFTSTGTPQLHVNNPRLWWPNGYGKPELYSLHLSFDLAGAASDSRDVTFGIREITYTLPGSDNLALSVNGVPIMCKGGDWGMDEAMKRIPRERLEAQIRFHQLANVNMIRNWVGQSTGEDFYDLCDRYGIMIWDEFFEPNPSDSGRQAAGVNDDSLDVRDVPMYLANVREKVLRYRNHPSIALWCGRNEGDPGPAAAAEGIKQIMAELEPVRLYHPNSNDGAGVRSGGPYAWRVPQDYYTFPMTGARPEAFKTEIGSVSIPTLEAVKAMMPEKDWNTINDDWAEHDLCFGAQSARGRLFQDLLAQRYGVSANLAEFVRKSQLACYESYRAMYEGRFAHLFTPCTGVLTWMSNPSQPSFVWQYYSYDLEPLASLYGTQKACEPVHVMMNQAIFNLMVVNNTPAALDGLTARVRVFNLDGTMKSDHTVNITAPASAVTDAGAIDFPADLSPVHFVKLELRDAAGKLLSDNFYWRALPTNAVDYTSLDKIATAQLDAKISRHDADGKCLLDVTLANPTQVIAVMAHIQLRRADTGTRVLPVYYSENFVSLLPGESRTITVEADAKNLGGAQPLVMLDGWNVTVKNQTFPGASIALNTDAQPGGEPRGAIGDPTAVRQSADVAAVAVQLPLSQPASQAPAAP